MLRISMFLVVLALAVFVLAPFASAEKADKADTQEGTFVKAGDGKITILDSKDKEHTFDMAKDAKILCDDKGCTIEDLKKNVKVKLTIENKTVTRVEASTK